MYRDLGDTEEPILKLEKNGWVISRPVDLRDYVTPRWDESYQPPIYSKGRWRKVRPVLEGYCERLEDPPVVQMRRRYRQRDQGSVVGDIVAERVALGKLDDPAQFGLEAVCAEADPSREPLSVSHQPVETFRSSAGRAATIEDVAAEEADRRRFALGLVGLHVTYPQIVSVSIAVMPTSQPRTFDCTTPCDFRGPFVGIEPGFGGGKLSIGWARVTGATNRSGSFLNAGYIGTVYKITVLHTWGDHGWVDGGRTYDGFEFGVPVAQATVGIGLL